MPADKSTTVLRLFAGASDLDKGSVHDAIQEFQAALRVEPDSTHAHLWLAAAYWEHGRHDEAIRQLQVAGRLGSWLAYEVVARVGHRPAGVQHRGEGLVTATPDNVADLLAMPEPPQRVWWEKAKMELCLVTAGEFLMGRLNGDGPADEQPQHTVYLDAYYIGRYPVTNYEYFEYSSAKWGHTMSHEYGLAADHYNPAILWSWDKAVAYCEWAGLRLPTEAEWEKAARGTDGRTYPWGEQEPDDVLGQWATREERPVGMYSPEGDSPYGCADMVGNVGEICVEPVLPHKRSLTARCGGSWAEDTLLTDVITVYGSSVRRETDVGFRCARGSQ